MYFADLHIHSRFSRATSRDGDLPHLDLWARRKGILLVGTGDFTHPAWRAEMAEQLCEAEEGLYRLKDEFVLPDGTAGEPLRPRFVVSGEISTIYKKDGKTRKVHHVILLPSLAAAEALSNRLAQVGNIRSDGRPILGLDSRDLLEIALETCPDCVFIPAHIWTPHFSVFGAFSGFERLEDCYGDLAGHIHALETGLSSDPPMNRRLSRLDRYQLVSHSDAHSPAKLGREADMLDGALSYPALKRALDTGEGLLGTVEFYPEEGKYHLDGHRACHCCLEPAETIRLDGRCPVCGRKVTVGVLHRVEELADRTAGGPNTPFESLMPLQELLGNCLGVGPDSKRAQAAYFDLLSRAGSEFFILRELGLEQAALLAGDAVAEGLRRLRAGQVVRQAGYDGEYGVISLFAPGELAVFQGQTTFLSPRVAAEKARPAVPVPPSAAGDEAAPVSAPELNPEQAACAETGLSRVAVVAGPGTGKTKTLVARIAHLLSQGVPAGDITAVTFTNLAARSLKSRLEAQLGKRAVKSLRVGTFHGLCLAQIPKKPLLDPAQALDIAGEIAPDVPPRDTLLAISRMKCEGAPEAESELLAAYQAKLEELGARDMDDILLEALRTDAFVPHLLVDECQDINAAQRRLMMKWSERGQSLFAIGDPDQSIYGFRGASAACFEELGRAFPDLTVMSLNRNYRSTPEILAFARQVITQNPGGERPLTPQRACGLPVRAGCAPDAAAEADWIAGEIQRMVGGMDMHEAHSDRPVRAFSDIAVLCRARRQLEVIERALRRADIPCQVSGSEDMLADPAVRAAIAMFRSLLEPENAFFARLAAASPRAGAVREGLLACPDASPEQRTRDYMRLSGQASQGLERLAAAAAAHKDMPSFLQALLLGEEADVNRLAGRRTPSGAVRLMTLHAAKGLEFPAVFLAGLEDGDFPLRRRGEVENLQEERRLFFVGITRAQEELILTCGGRPSAFFPAETQAERFAIRPRIRAEQLSLF